MCATARSIAAREWRQAEEGSPKGKRRLVNTRQTRRNERRWSSRYGRGRQPNVSTITLEVGRESRVRVRGREQKIRSRSRRANSNLLAARNRTRRKNRAFAQGWHKLRARYGNRLHHTHVHTNGRQEERKGKREKEKKEGDGGKQQVLNRERAEYTRYIQGYLRG